MWWWKGSVLDKLSVRQNEEFQVFVKHIYLIGSWNQFKN